MRDEEGCVMCKQNISQNLASWLCFDGWHELGGRDHLYGDINAVRGF